MTRGALLNRGRGVGGLLMTMVFGGERSLAGASKKRTKTQTHL